MYKRQATASSSQNFTFTYSLTAGNNPIYVSSSSTLALTSTTTGTTGTVSLISFRDSDSTGDGAGYFYLAPGQLKTFTASFISRGGASGTYSITGLNYGSAWSGSAVTGTGSLNAPLVGSTLFASLGY